MNKIIIIIVLCLLSKISFAQMIKSFESSASYETDSSVVVYKIRLKLNTHTTDSTRLNLVKNEFNKRYQVELDKIFSIQTWYGKQFRTFLYTIKFHNLNGNNLKKDAGVFKADGEIGGGE